MRYIKHHADLLDVEAMDELPVHERESRAMDEVLMTLSVVDAHFATLKERSDREEFKMYATVRTQVVEVINDYYDGPVLAKRPNRDKSPEETPESPLQK